jgi:YHS domain-containing protein
MLTIKRKNKMKAEFNGHCAFAVSTGKKDVTGGNHQTIIDGKTYVFSNAIAKILFSILPNRVKKAEEVWANV